MSVTESESALNELRRVADRLDASDQEFARSLIEQFDRYGRLSIKQQFWVARLKAKAAPPEVITVGGMGGIVELLKHAQQHVNYPKLALQHGGAPIASLYIAKNGSRYAGKIVVRGRLDFDENWISTITPEGEFVADAAMGIDLRQHVIEALMAVSSNPARAASEYGRLMGHCCFCRRPLTDARSLMVGYGQVCAKDFGLPWGEKEPID